MCRPSTTPGRPGMARIAVDETVILLHSPLPLVGVSIVMERERQRNDKTLVRGSQALVASSTLFEKVVESSASRILMTCSVPKFVRKTPIMIIRVKRQWQSCEKRPS